MSYDDLGTTLDIPGFRIGHAGDSRGMTGVTVVRTEITSTPSHREPGTWVLLASDGSPAALDATGEVRDTFHDAEVVVLTVVDGRRVADASAAEAIQDRTCGDLGRPARRLVRSGRPSTVIRDVAETLCIDVVAIGAPSRHPRLRTSTAESLLRHLDCEVLVVPRASEPRPRRPRPAGA